MPNCMYLFSCSYFNGDLKNMPIASNLVKQMYCFWHFDECSRYKVAMAIGRESVPHDLFPTEFQRAEKIIAKH